MASDQDFVDYVVDQMRAAGGVSSRKMFGEYAVYCDGKVVALVCDNQLFIKATEAGRNFIGEPREAPPYPGARLAFLIDEELEDAEWVSQLVRLTGQALPPPDRSRKQGRKQPQQGQAGQASGVDGLASPPGSNKVPRK